MSLLGNCAHGSGLYSRESLEKTQTDRPSSRNSLGKLNLSSDNDAQPHAAGSVVAHLSMNWNQILSWLNQVEVMRRAA